jgi:hypothetical protein
LFVEFDRFRTMSRWSTSIDGGLTACIDGEHVTVDRWHTVQGQSDDLSEHLSLSLESLEAIVAFAHNHTPPKCECCGERHGKFTAHRKAA